LEKNLKQYHDLLQHILDNGEDVNDRTGVGTRSVFGYQMRFDLSAGFPAVTTKKLAWKSVVSELLWFLEGSTDERRLAELLYGKDRTELVDRTTIWSANADAQGKALGYVNNDTVKQLGPVYGYAWSKLESTVDEIIEIESRFIEQRHDMFDRQELCVPVDGGKDDFIGKTLVSNHEREFIVIDKRNTCSNSEYKVQFLDTHDIMWVTRPNLRRGQVGKQIICGVAVNDYEGKIHQTDLGKRIHTLWYNMIRRCYDANLPEFVYYGDRGIRVCKRWHRLSNFVSDIEKIPNYYSWVKNPTDYALDKDYYNSDGYSPTTCVFIRAGYNCSLKNNSIDFRSVKLCEFPDGKTIKFIFNKDLMSLYPENNFTNEGIRLALLKGGKHRKCKFTRISGSDGSIFRKKLLNSQLEYVLDKLKNEPDSRRIILTAWVPQLIQDMALPPCHFIAQFRVINGKLSCMLTMRANDAFLGAPFNIASYALLTYILARECGLGVGELVYSIGDAHIYHNHFDQVREQLSRTEFPLPTLSIAEDFSIAGIKTGLNFEFPLNSVDKFKLVGYNSHSTIKAEMAV
jgi:thymidylate synthase